MLGKAFNFIKGKLQMAPSSKHTLALKPRNIVLQQFSFRSSDTQAKCPTLSNQLPKFATSVFVSLLLLLGMQSTAFAVFAAIEQVKQVNKSFRETYPFHRQIIGLTPPLRDKSRVLIISEPPPHIDPQYFQKFVDSIDKEASVGGKAFFIRNRIGYDGWVTDVMLALPPLSEDKLSKGLTQLHRDLYGTAYKANAVKLPIKLPPANNRSLDLSVSVSDLNNWLLKENLKFTPTIGGKSRSLPKILSSGQSGVFIGAQRGLVIWSIPRNQDLAKYRAEARQFFLDSDLIVGAIANNRQLAVIARERVEPLLHLPPLRVETALMLASEKSEQLGQSYERKNIFAGKLPNGKDWAPIYLSNNLINTEFGSLLNITDQLLKSWSLNGDIEYINFAYPKPSKWASFPRPIKALQKAREIDSIRFNWNTKGLGYTTSLGAYKLFALNRTGALPITYDFKASSVQTYEKVAHNYFSRLSNPDLARVVQYTAIYQIFRKFGITTTESPIQGSLFLGNVTLGLEAFNLVSRLKAFSPDDFMKRLQTVVKKGEISSQRADVLRQGILTHKKKIENLTDAINRGEARWSENAIFTLASVIASPRTYIPTIKDPELRDWVLSTYVLLIEPDIRWLIVNLFDIEQVKDRYVTSLGKSHNTWIKTSSIVLSKDTVNFRSVGGHSLDSKLTRLQSSSNVPIGKVQLVIDKNEPVILYNPKDLDRIHRLSRKFATATDGRTLIKDLEKSLKGASSNPRSLTQALNLPTKSSTPIQPSSRGFQLPKSSPPLGWRLRNKPLTGYESQKLIEGDKLGVPSIIIERSPNGYVVFQSGNKQAVEVHAIDTLHDEVLPQLMGSIPKGDQPIPIYFNGFTSDEAKAFVLTGDMRQKTQQVVFRKNGYFRKNIDLTTRTYDWDKAIVTKAKFEPVSNNFTSSYKAVIDVTAISTKHPPLRIRIIAFFKELPKNIRDSINAIIQKVLARPNTQSLNANEIILDIRREIRKEFPDIDIEFQVEAGDIYITEPARRNRITRRMSDGN